jgi:hypothetical protein
MSSLAHHRSSRHHDDTVFLGMDVHKDSISVGVPTPASRTRTPHDANSGD